MVVFRNEHSFYLCLVFSLCQYLWCDKVSKLSPTNIHALLCYSPRFNAHFTGSESFTSFLFELLTVTTEIAFQHRLVVLLPKLSHNSNTTWRKDDWQRHPNWISEDHAIRCHSVVLRHLPHKAAGANTSLTFCRSFLASRLGSAAGIARSILFQQRGGDQPGGKLPEHLQATICTTQSRIEHDRTCESVGQFQSCLSQHR